MGFKEQRDAFLGLMLGMLSGGYVVISKVGCRP